MNFIVSEEFLDEIRCMITCYSFHSRKCSWHDTKICDCGFIKTREKIYNMALDIKEIKEIE